MSDDEFSGELRLQRLVPATPERVFRAWTDAGEMKKWWGPAGVTCRSAQIDLRVGGEYKIENELPDGTTLWIVGNFEVIEQPHRLVYSWRVGESPAALERVTVRFAAHERGTQLSLLHERIGTAALRRRHRDGWRGCLEGLMEFVVTGGGRARSRNDGPGPVRHGE